MIYKDFEITWAALRSGDLLEARRFGERPSYIALGWDPKGNVSREEVEGNMINVIDAAILVPSGQGK